MLSDILVITSSFFIYYYIKKAGFFNICFLIYNDYVRIFKIFFESEVDQERKEKTLIKFSITLFLNSLKIIILFIIFSILIFILNTFDKSFINHALSFIGILESVITIICSHYLIVFYDKL